MLYDRSRKVETYVVAPLLESAATLDIHTHAHTSNRTQPLDTVQRTGSRSIIAAVPKTASAGEPSLAASTVFLLHSSSCPATRLSSRRLPYGYAVNRISYNGLPVTVELEECLRPCLPSSTTSLSEPVQAQ